MSNNSGPAKVINGTLDLTRLRGLEVFAGLKAPILRHHGKKVGTTGLAQFDGFAGAWIFGGACSGKVS